jgi:hypothetical protein
MPIIIEKYAFLTVAALVDVARPTNVPIVGGVSQYAARDRDFVVPTGPYRWFTSHSPFSDENVRWWKSSLARSTDGEVAPGAPTRRRLASK